MRIPSLSIRWASPFDGLLEHAEKVKECGWAFQQAVECHLSEKCQAFEEYRQEVVRLESEADAIKRRIRGHLPKGTRMKFAKFELFGTFGSRIKSSIRWRTRWTGFPTKPFLPNTRN